MNSAEQSTEQTVKELTLMLLYLASWQDRPARMRPEADGIISWKGYRFEILNALEDEGYIYGERRSKLVTLDDNGILKAKELLAKYGISEDNT